MVNKEFDLEIKYKLYRNVREILHPTISKKNISNYIIIIDEELFPVRVFYPQKISNISRVMIYIHGNGNITGSTGNYSNICKKFASKNNTLVIAVEYEDIKRKFQVMYEKIYETVKFLYRELERNEVQNKNIILVGDSTGCNIITAINQLRDSKLKIGKEILFYPIINVEKIKKLSKNDDNSFYTKLNEYYTYISYKKYMTDKLLNPLKLDNYKGYPETLIFVGNQDIIKEDVEKYSSKLKKSKYIELDNFNHGFLTEIKDKTEKDIYDTINEFYI